MNSEVKDEVRQRLRSPFYASWVIAFALLNWNAILVVLFPQEGFDIRDRLDWIAGNYYDTPLKHALRVYVGPFIAAVLALSALPWFINILDRVQYKALVARRIRRDELDLQQSNTQMRIQGLETEVKRLEQANSSAVQAIQSRLSENEQLKGQQLQMLLILVKSDQQYVDIIHKLHGTGQVKMQPNRYHNLLAALGVITKRSADVFELTKLGIELSGHL